jgi:hypothetical protein
MKAEEVLHGSKVGDFYVLSENPFPYTGFVRNRKFLLKGILLLLFIAPTKISTSVLVFRLDGGDKASLQDVTVQRSILVPLDLIHMLVAMSNTVFVSVCTSLVVIRFGANDQLVSSNLLSSHRSDGGEEMVQKGEGGRGEKTPRAKRAQSIDS